MRISEATAARVRDLVAEAEARACHEGSTEGRTDFDQNETAKPGASEDVEEIVAAVRRLVATAGPGPSPSRSTSSWLP